MGVLGRDSVIVSLVLDDIMVTGTVHTPTQKSRFSDAWEALLRESRDFVPVTDVEVTDHETGSASSEPFMLVDKSDVVAVYPRDPASIGTGSRGRFPVLAVKAVVMLDRLRIEGCVHLPPGKDRFSDAWELLMGDPREYVPITEARVLSPDGSREIATAEFLDVEKGEIVAAYPSGEEPRDAGSWRRPTRSVSVAVVVGTMRVEGTVHVESPKPNFERFSDLWDLLMRDRRRYIPLTDAKVTSLDAAHAFGEAPFLLIDKREARAAFPLEV